MTPPPARPDTGLRRRGRAVLAVGLGGVAALGLAPFNAWWATLAALVVLARLFLDTSGPRKALWLGWRFGLGYFAVGLMWIVEPFLVDIGHDGWMAPFALVFMSGGLALFWAAAFWSAAALFHGSAARVAGLVLAWSMAEMLRAYVFTGFPWAAPAQIWTATGLESGPVTGPALTLAWIGPHGLALWTLASALPLPLLLGAGGARWLAALPGAALVVTGTWLSAGREPPDSSGALVRLVQPNAPQHLKWDPDHVWTFFERQIDLTARHANDAPPDLIVWPETSIPPFLHNAGRELAAIANAAAGTPVVAGIRRSEGRRFFNTLVVVGPEGTIVGQYDKHHLVPFGEYMPLAGLAARLGLHGLAAEEGGGFSAGPGPVLLPIPGFGQALPLICYEAVFAQDVSAAPARPDLLLQITNDAWFGTRTGPYQHLAQARMRAIEQGLPLIRSANTGVSAVIGPRGGVVAVLPLNTAGALDVRLPAALPPTLYARTGDMPVTLALVAALIVLIGLQYRPRDANSD